MKTLQTLLTALTVIALIVQVPATLAQSETLTAGFMADVNTGAAPLTVHFKDTSGGSPTGWRWDFGDGSYSTLQNPVYTFSEPGTYTVRLTVTDGTQSDAMSGDIVVTNPLVRTPYPGLTPVIVEPILVPVKAPHHTKPPAADPPHKAPVRSPQPTPTKSPAKAPAKAPVKAPAKTPDKTPTKTPGKAPEKQPTKSPQRSSDRQKQRR